MNSNRFFLPRIKGADPGIFQAMEEFKSLGLVLRGGMGFTEFAPNQNLLILTMNNSKSAVEFN
jgi:hypothetical protein